MKQLRTQGTADFGAAATTEGDGRSRPRGPDYPWCRNQYNRIRSGRIHRQDNRRGAGATLVVGDALAHAVIAFAHPDWQPAADHDPERAATTRKTLLSRLASDRTRLIGYHLPFPGIGFVEASGSAFRFAPIV